MTNSGKKIFGEIKDYVLITLGMALYVSAWTIFLTPFNLVGGGVSGISSIIQYATGFKMGYTYLLINVVLLFLAVSVLGRSFGGKTVYAILLVSGGLSLGQGIIPAELIDALVIQNGKLLATIIGGALAGIGMGMAFSVGGSSGGTDIIALIVNKYRNIPPGKVLLFLDVIIIGSSLLFPSYKSDGTLVPMIEKITTVVYGVIMVTISTNALDMYLSGSKQSVQLFVLSRKYEEIADEITKNFGRGVTVLSGMGWYTKRESKVLMVITRKTEMNLLLRAIKSIDKDAFLSVGSVMGVYGEGFDKIKDGSGRPKAIKR